jgi:hypothetical protein
MLSASLAGCFGDDEDGNGDYAGPIDLVVYYDTTSGQIEQVWNGDTNTQNDGVTLTFDFASTTSSDADINTIFIDPDDGSDRVEESASDTGEVSYTWMTHGLFEVSLGAVDKDDNEYSIMINIRIDMHIVRSESPSLSHTMTFDVTSDCSDGVPLPNRIVISSEADNPQGFVITGGNAEVNWTLTDSGENEIDSHQGTIPDSGSETWDTSTMAIVAGDWILSVEVTQGDEVSVNNDVTITYVEGSESPINPRPA